MANANGEPAAVWCYEHSLRGDISDVSFSFFSLIFSLEWNREGLTHHCSSGIYRHASDRVEVLHDEEVYPTGLDWISSLA